MTGVQTCALPICFPVTIEDQLDTAVAFALNVTLRKEYGWTNYTRDLYKAMLYAAPQPQPIDVEKLKAIPINGDNSARTKIYIRGYNDAIDHLCAHYNITKKGE